MLWGALRMIVGAMVLASAGTASAETITYTYDALGRMVRVEVAGGESGATQQTYEYDAAGNRKRVNATGGSSSGGPVGNPQVSASTLRVAYNGRFFLQKK